MPNSEVVDKICRELADKGQLIEAGWVSLRLTTIPADAPQIQLDEMRNAFFAGAQHLFGSIMGILESGEEATEQDLKRMDLIDKELKNFIAQFTAQKIGSRGKRVMSEDTVPDLYRLAFVPGSFRCPKCNFVLAKQTMFVGSGTIGISESDLDSEQCPNDGTDMVHVTWKERALELSDRLTEVIKWEKKHPLNWKQNTGKLADALGLNVEDCRKIEDVVEQHIRDKKTLKQLIEFVGEMEISDAMWVNFLYTYGYFDGQRSL